MSMVNAAKLCILYHWCFTIIPVLHESIRRLNNMEEMEEQIHISEDKITKFTSTWYCWLDFKETAEYRSYVGVS